MNEDIKVSVCSLAFNHEKYIRKTLEGFVMQKTNFRFEVLINDDASTDKTAEIIREYESKYPDIFKPIYQTENQYSQGKKITFDILVPKAKGKYIALCEGDDYWTDPLKLQKQYDCLEKNKDCNLCIAKVQDIDANGNLINHVRPDNGRKQGKIYTDEFLPMVIRMLSGIECYQFQTSTYFLRKENLINYPKRKFMLESPVGDMSILYYYGSLGPVYYIDQIFSKYRIGAPGSWNSNIDKDKKVANYKKFKEVLSDMNDFTNNKYQSDILCATKRCNFVILRAQGNYKKMIRDYKEYYKLHTGKERLYFRVFSYFPSLESKYQELRKKQKI